MVHGADTRYWPTLLMICLYVCKGRGCVVKRAGAAFCGFNMHLLGRCENSPPRKSSVIVSVCLVMIRQAPKEPKVGVGSGFLCLLFPFHSLGMPRCISFSFPKHAQVQLRER